DFLEQFARLVEQAGFVFAREDLINLHVCVKTGQLTVLAGMSGTGKSSLPRLYAEALGCGEEYLHVPVRPDWLDDRDLIGAFNAVAQRFEPAPSGLVERLIAAAEDRLHHRGGIYLICLDEMNLARVEHYFAQFLSVLELPPARRYLTLFSQGLAPADDPYRDYHRILLGDNVRFLGTVNIDETTHFFSPKVLDRSQVVAFGAPNLEAPRRVAGASAKPPVPVSLDTWLSWRRPGVTESTARAFLVRINDVLRRSRLGIGFRQFDRMLDYVASARPFLAEDRALDLQLSQVILPRLRPTAPGFAETLQALRQVVTGDRFPRTADHLARLAEARAEDDFFQLL
ncbi:MAG TPA: AAA family ATPase, partial [Gemmataceae bacterium]|nr:AAA family ATPase [Gemmataceae bacterium]